MSSVFSVTTPTATFATTDKITHIVLKVDNTTHIFLYKNIFSPAFEQKHKKVIPASYISDRSSWTLLDASSETLTLASPMKTILYINYLSQDQSIPFINIMNDVIAEQELDLLIMLKTNYHQLFSSHKYTFDDNVSAMTLKNYYNILYKMRTVAPHIWINYFKQLIAYDKICLYVKEIPHILNKSKNEIASIAAIIKSQPIKMLPISNCPYALRPNLNILYQMQQTLQTFDWHFTCIYICSSLNKQNNICGFKLSLISELSVDTRINIEKKLVELCHTKSLEISKIHGAPFTTQFYVRLYDLTPEHTDMYIHINTGEIFISNKMIGEQLANYKNSM